MERETRIINFSFETGFTTQKWFWDVTNLLYWLFSFVQSGLGELSFVVDALIFLYLTGIPYAQSIKLFFV